MSNSKYIITLSFIGLLFVVVVVLFRSGSSSPDNSPVATNGTNKESIAVKDTVPSPEQNTKDQEQDEPVVESCIITVNGVEYDVQPFRDSHEGGDIFQCGSDMTDDFKDEHGFRGEEFEELQKYRIE